MSLPQSPPRKEFKIERYAYYLLRGLIRLVTAPVAALDESRFKDWVRLLVLSVQHSLAIELAVNRGDVVVQIGTPWPRTLHRFRKAIGAEGQLVIFEAEPGNYDRLKGAVEESNYANVHLVPGAAWYESKSGKLAISPYKGDHKIMQEHVAMDNDLRPGNKVMEQIDVQFLTVDKVLDDLGIEKLDYMSVTVNGAELEVLKGAERVLRCSPGARVYAKGHALLEDGNPLHTMTEAFMQTLGYHTKVTRGEPSSTKSSSWLWRAGDLFAWKDRENDATSL